MDSRRTISSSRHHGPGRTSITTTTSLHNPNTLTNTISIPHAHAAHALYTLLLCTRQMGVVTGLVPLDAPEVFLDLHDGNEALGRVYITLQSHLHRAQQFLALCVGEKGPSYRNSLFHSVLRRSGTGEGLLGGDYEGKAGKGGAAIFGGVQGEEEVAKRCERGMVVRGNHRAEMAAQFCIMVRDGPRNKSVFPFGRVSKGISVVEEACRRPAMTVGVAECGWVLPV
ncbi:Peptidyl-prolyl cis-trans isomerase B1 [Portunus trituberculatus]|uniref:Peptidyl-prolyl cis-trans isomerase B1 n=1 Tax=Portunus trituberculatus TaxID=210409 RepID=A0A5B7GX18_PORTR|nr:Peptidyl-prolyl cis-trans isomerase B1 [Portunus trituberculatus]